MIFAEEFRSFKKWPYQNKKRERKASMAESPSKKARVDELAKFISDTNDAYEKLHLVRAAALFTELWAQRYMMQSCERCV